MLWIWDNVEPVTGFPAGTASDWSVDEQQELLAFLRAAQETTQAKFLLTSRRNEALWLGELPRRIEVPAMPMQERLQLAGEIVARRGGRLAELPDLTPLLRFTQGNPLTIVVVIGEALRAGIDTAAQLKKFVEALLGGEVKFQDEEILGRSKSLGASLSYGFGAAFDENGRTTLALLHLFQGIVFVDALRIMGSPDSEWCLEEVREVSNESSAVQLLDRAAEVGLLNALGEGYYGIHPALPWYFRTLFERYFPEATGAAGRARHAFAEAFSILGDYYTKQYESGNREALAGLEAEEGNLRAAWHIARAGGWRDSIMYATQALIALYEATGRRAAKRRLVEEVLPSVIDPATDGPLPGYEDAWGLITDYRVRLARDERNSGEAERLTRMQVTWSRRRAEAALKVKPEIWNQKQKHDIRNPAVSLELLGLILRERGDQTCSQFYMEAIGYHESLDAKQEQAVCALNLGQAYRTDAVLHDLDQAEHWFRKSLDLHHPKDGIGRGRCLSELASVSFLRFLQGKKDGLSREDMLPHLLKAEKLYLDALEMTPASALYELGVKHNQLGALYGEAGDIDRALYHFQRDIRYCELAGDIFGAGTTRRNVAVALVAAERWLDASEYARAALVNFQSFGDGAAKQISEAERLIAFINQAIAQQRLPS